MAYEKKNVRVLADDTDAFGRLNWLAYLRYCEEGEAGIFEKIGISATRFYKERNISFPRRAASFEYCSQVSPDSFIDIETTIKRIGKTSFTLLHTFYKKNAEDGERTFAASAEVTVVAFDHRIYQKIEIPKELLDGIKGIARSEFGQKKVRCTS
jgi:YbgC/YbaW family acyl-CoA thioester hydrolase